MDVISMRDFSKAQIEVILDSATEIKQAIHNPQENKKFKKKHGRPVNKLLEGIKVGTLFLENSTRTNYSSRAAVLNAGGYVDGFSSPDHTSLKKGETFSDTIGMFAGYGFNSFVLRSTIEGLPRWSKEFLNLNYEHVSKQHHQMGFPYSYNVSMIINGGDGKNQHPTQCLLDLMTIREVANSLQRPMDGLPISLINDIPHSRVLSSLISVAHLYNFELHFTNPPRFGPTEKQQADLQRRNVKFYLHNQDLDSALESGIIAYHTRPQKERVGAGEDLVTIKEFGMLTIERWNKLGTLAPFLFHALPVDSVTFEEIHHTMRFHPLNFSKYQAMNGPPIRSGINALGLGRMISPISLEQQVMNHSKFSLHELPIYSEKERPENPTSGYLKQDGIVIDHIPPGMGKRIIGVLGLDKIPKTLSDYIEGKKKPLKDILKIRGDYTLAEKQLEALGLMAPLCTVSIVKNTAVIRKFRINTGNYIEDRIDCGNEYCVTNIPNEHVPTRHRIETPNILRCDYCETEDSIPQVYQEQRFKYMPSI